MPRQVQPNKGRRYARALMLALVAMPALGPQLAAGGAFSRCKGKASTTLWQGLVLFLVATEPGSHLAEAQGTAALTFAPAFNLSGSDPVSLVAAQGVHLVLVHANRSGALPPLPDLNALLAENSPLSVSLLATLPDDPATASGPTSLLASPATLASTATELLGALPSPGPVPLPQANPSALAGRPQAVAAPWYVRPGAIAALSAAQANVVYGIFESIGHQLAAVGNLVVNNTQLSSALKAASEQVESLGYILLAGIFERGVLVLQSEIDTLAEQDQLGSAPSPGAPVASPLGTEFIPGVQRLPLADANGCIDPRLLHGRWQSPDAACPGCQFWLDITPTEFQKFNLTVLPSGRKAGHAEVHPCATSVDLDYELPDTPPDQNPDPGVVKALVVIGKPNGASITMNFYLFRVNISGQPTDILLDQAVPGRIFIKVPRPGV